MIYLYNGAKEYVEMTGMFLPVAWRVPREVLTLSPYVLDQPRQ